MESLGGQTRLALTLLGDHASPRILKIQGCHIVALHDPHNDLLECPDLRGTLLDLLLEIRALVIQTTPLHNRGRERGHIGLLGKNDLIIDCATFGHFTTVYKRSMFRFFDIPLQIPVELVGQTVTKENHVDENAGRCQNRSVLRDRGPLPEPV